MKVYTRTGDTGTSALFTGERRGKDDKVFEALGTTDHLNAQVGLARQYCKSNGLDEYLAEIQHCLFDVGGHIATPPASANEARLRQTAFNGEHVDTLENWIDKLTESLPPLRKFILPGGGIASSHLHLCRTSCRTAERSIVLLIDEIDPNVIKYINSDFFFVSARYAAFKDGTPEVLYLRD